MSARQGGPAMCPRPCGECSAERHHFSEPMIGLAELNPSHEAARLGVEVWWECKHCDAWMEWQGDEDESLYDYDADEAPRYEIGEAWLPGDDWMPEPPKTGGAS